MAKRQGLTLGFYVRLSNLQAVAAALGLELELIEFVT